jgi:2-methylisocitrate lyase-like PEP mutase family enzyme
MQRREDAAGRNGMGHQAQALRDLFKSGENFIAADVYSALTGRIVQHVGFKAAYLGGAACGAMHYAVPDIGILSQIEQIEQAQRIAAAIDIPLIVDADTLGETVADAFHLTRRYEQAGIAGFHVEDEVNPKHSSFDNGLASIADMQARIDACVRARRDPAFLLIARCDELYSSAMGGGGGGSVEEAIKRGKAYAEAGADALVFPLSSAEAMDQLVDALPIPVSAMGFPHPRQAFLMSTGWGWSGAAKLHLERSLQLMETGQVDMGDGPFDDTAFVDKLLYRDLIADWARKTGRPVR